MRTVRTKTIMKGGGAPNVLRLELLAVIGRAVLVCGALAHRLHIGRPVLQLATGAVLGSLAALRSVEDAVLLQIQAQLDAEETRLRRTASAGYQQTTRPWDTKMQAASLDQPVKTASAWSRRSCNSQYMGAICSGVAEGMPSGPPSPIHVLIATCAA